MRVSSIRWGVIWIGIGLFFLAINFGTLDSLVFPRLFSLWPVLLIAVGVELIFRRTKFYFLALLSPLLIAAAFIVAASYKGGPGWDLDGFLRSWSWRYEGEKTDLVEIPLDDAIDTLDITLDCGPVEFDMKSVSDRLFSAQTRYYKKSPIISHRSESKVEFINFENREELEWSLLNIVGSGQRIDFEIPDRLPVEMSISTEADFPDLDFSDLRLTRLKSYVRSGDVTVRLGDLEDLVRAEVSGKADELAIVVPSGFGLEITGDRGRLDDALEGTDLVEFAGGYRSGDFDRARQKAIILLDARVKKVTINAY
jgi:hypothetical protein